MQNEEYAKLVDDKYKDFLLKSFYKDTSEDLVKYFLRFDPISRLTLKKFLNLYRKSEYCYNNKKEEEKRERVSKLLKLLADIKFQTALILFENSSYNHYLYGGKYVQKEVLDTPNLLLIQLSIDQNLIVKNRILFEKVMNFIYFLEKDEDFPRSTGKKGKFFKFIYDTKWSYLLKYEKIFNDYDTDLRTHEVHLISKLSDCFHEGNNPQKYLIDPDKINIIDNFVRNMFWPVLIMIMEGKDVSPRYWEIGMEKLSGIKSNEIFE